LHFFLGTFSARRGNAWEYEKGYLKIHKKGGVEVRE